MEIRLGVMARLESGPDRALRQVRDLGFSTCQTICWQADLFNQEVARQVRRASIEHDVEITTIWAGLPGKYVWNFVEGPRTIGLVPEKTRRMRLEVLKQASDFAAWVGVPSVTTHVGFIPEDPADRLYVGLIGSLKQVAGHCAKHQQDFWFETGQETPITLLRAIEDVGCDNLGVNLDPANLLLYGKANPVDALDIIGHYVRGVHAKDGEYPTNGRELGSEKPLGEGRVNFPVLLSKLNRLGFRGALTIEREITGPRQIDDIKKAKRLLEEILSSL